MATAITVPPRLKRYNAGGKHCGLKPNPIAWRLVRQWIRFSDSLPPACRTAEQAHGVPGGRRGAQCKSSFDVCLSDFEWEKPDGEDSPRKQGVAASRQRPSYDPGSNTCSASWSRCVNLSCVAGDRIKGRKAFRTRITF